MGMMGDLQRADLSSSVALNEAESKALWDLVEAPGERLWMNFLREATSDALKTRQFVARSEPALIAAVGLDRTSAIEPSICWLTVCSYRR